jgi:hypothetical protein
MAMMRGALVHFNNRETVSSHDRTFAPFPPKRDARLSPKSCDQKTAATTQNIDWKIDTCFQASTLLRFYALAPSQINKSANSFHLKRLFHWAVTHISIHIA